MKARFEKFSSSQEAKVKADFERMKSMVTKTAGSSLPLVKWFGAADRTRLARNLVKMRTVVEDPNRTATFVNRTDGVLKVEYHSLLKPVLLPKGSKGNPLEERNPVTGKKTGYGAGAYAFPVNRMGDVRGATTLDDLDVLDTSSHVGSGMRLYLTSVYFTMNDRARSATIYHEITHKVLACEDYGYGATFCKNLAKDPNKAIRNADNYAMFLMDC